MQNTKKIIDERIDAISDEIAILEDEHDRESANGRRAIVIKIHTLRAERKGLNFARTALDAPRAL